MPVPLKLSRREREILDAMFALGDKAAADEIRDRLTDPPSYSAVRAMLARLEAKGVIRHRAEGLRYVYSPAVSRTAAQKNAVSQLVRVFFRGSAGETAAALLKQEQWTDEELDELSARIQEVRNSRRRS